MSGKREKDGTAAIRASHEIETLPVNERTSASRGAEKLRELGEMTCSDQESNHDQKRNPKTMTEQTLDVLINAKKPMTVPEIWKTLYEKEGSKKTSLAGVRDHISYLYKNKEIKRIARGVYVYLEFDDANYESPKKLDELIVEILNTAGRPLKNKEIIDHLNMDSIENLTLKRTQYCLGRLCNEAKIQQLSQGVYACLEFDDANYEPPKNFGELIVEILNTAGQPMSTKSIFCQLNENPTRQPQFESIKTTLRVMYKQGRIKRLAEGVYACLEFDDEKYLPPETIPQRILRILNDTKQPMKIKQITDRLDENSSENFSCAVSKIRNHLGSLCRQGRIKHLAEGVYACLEFDDAKYEPPKKLGEFIVEILNTAGRPMKNKEIMSRLDELNLAKTNNQQVYNQLGQLLKHGEIQHLAEGVYACLKFEGQYEIEKAISQPVETKREESAIPVRAPRSSTTTNPQADEDQYDVLLQQSGKQRVMTVGGRIAKITSSWVGPMTVEGIIEALNKDGFRKVNPEIARPLVEIRLRREKERLAMRKGRA